MYKVLILKNGLAAILQSWPKAVLIECVILLHFLNENFALSFITFLSLKFPFCNLFLLIISIQSLMMQSTDDSYTET